MLTPDQKGTIAETAIIAQAVRLGIDVYRPVNDGLRWDLLFGSDTKFLRVQCKWAAWREGVVKVTLRSCRRTRHGFERRPYSRQDVDLVAAHCALTDSTYLIPPDIFDGRPEIWLRLAPTKNNQRLGVNWARDFEFGARLGPYAEGAIAQLGERVHGMHEVAGSSPAGSTDEAALRGLSLFE